MSFFTFVEREPSGEAPHFVEPLQPQVAREKQCVRIHAVVEAKPVPEITWHKGEEEIVPSKTRTTYYQPETGIATLTLHEPTIEDEAVYMCRAVNKFGQAESRANLIIGKLWHLIIILECSNTLGYVFR
jgi:titin